MKDITDRVFSKFMNIIKYIVGGVISSIIGAIIYDILKGLPILTTLINFFSFIIYIKNWVIIVIVISSILFYLFGYKKIKGHQFLYRIKILLNKKNIGLLPTTADDIIFERQGLIEQVKRTYKSAKLDSDMFFSFDEALSRAKERKMKLFSKQEWEILIEIGYTFDDKMKVIWLGPDSNLKGESKNSISLRETAYKINVNDAIAYSGDSGFYWTSTSIGESAAYCLYFSGIEKPKIINKSKNSGYAICYFNL